MTNEEKVELRMLVMSMARTYRREEAQIGGKDIEQRFQTINDGRDSILSLIDRQPSEGELNSVKRWLREGWRGGWFFDDPQAIVRKVFNIEDNE